MNFDPPKIDLTVKETKRIVSFEGVNGEKDLFQQLLCKLATENSTMDTYKRIEEEITNYRKWYLAEGIKVSDNANIMLAQLRAQCVYT